MRKVFFNIGAPVFDEITKTVQPGIGEDCEENSNLHSCSEVEKQKQEPGSNAGKKQVPDYGRNPFMGFLHKAKG